MYKFYFFADPGLTQQLDTLAIFRPTSGAGPGTDRVIYLGSTDNNRYIQAASAPGIDPINLWIVESGVDGTTPEHVVLALTAGGLDSSVPGAALQLPVTLYGGVTNALPVHVRVITPALSAGEYTVLRLETDDYTVNWL